MPFYEYRCDSCGHDFEALQKISDEPLRHCPACDEPQLRKLISAAGFRLKGSQMRYPPPTGRSFGDKRPLVGGSSPAALPVNCRLSTVTYPPT